MLHRPHWTKEEKTLRLRRFLGFLCCLAVLTAGCGGSSTNKPGNVVGRSLFVTTDPGHGVITRVSPDGRLSTFASGINFPGGMAFDRSGNLYVTSTFDGKVYKVTPAGVQSVFASGFVSPTRLAFDSQGNLYVSSLGYQNTPDPTAGSIKRVTPDGTVSTVMSGLDRPHAIALDSQDNLYIAYHLGGQGTLSKLTPGRILSTYATGFKDGLGMAFDKSGNLFLTDSGNLFSSPSGTDRILKIAPDGSVSTFATKLFPTDVTFDAAGNLYVTQENGYDILKFTPDGARSTYVRAFNDTAHLQINGATALRFSPAP